MVQIKEKIPLDWKMTVKTLLSSYKKWEEKREINKKYIYIFLAGFYQNLGDMAITLAQRQFLHNCFPDAKIVIIPDNETYPAVRAIKKTIQNNDLVTLIGGGNMSDLYIHHETARRHVINSFPNNRIVSFPQTMYFSENELGRKQLAKSQMIYNKHKDLYIFARESDSLKRMKCAFPNLPVRIAPDIVLSLKKFYNSPRRGIICCLRKDKEQRINPDYRSYLIDQIATEFDKVETIDTVDVDEKECTEDVFEHTLIEYWEKFGKAECVVTDRLHGMIFCEITGTPCIALDNTNHKVKAVYDKWLKNCKYIRLINEDKNLIIEVKNLINTCENKETIDFEEDFEELKNVCLEIE